MTGPLFRLLFRLSALLLAAVCVSAPAFAQPLPGRPAGPETDLNMVVALDRSESVDLAERTAQNESLAAALTDPRFMAAVKGGWQGRIGIAVLTWSSFNRTQVVVPWTVIAERRDADAVVAALRDYQARGGDVEHRPQTDIALALGAGVELLDAAPFPATKRILNVISDGIDNFGREAFVDRDEALAHGITINGLVHARGSAIPIVERFFERQVIGGPYAFVLSTPTPESFTGAMLRKMLLEIAAAGRSSRPDGSGSLRVPAYRPMRG
ncbi:hypothetical protein GCM10017083_00610 [Thalassobaculum fulvum]|uniref:VWFA domain-containing protein n=1 Tax=Thalassobaculum fulvum TaxID=1633335 RepID=A0A919CNL7_9PROT|nr:DUF1194 domain-containing protein [Thalassobaculum fulvum]GHD39117.1 hypothetical protein GCM10017083_00610 [Thalassobaculum fulvum]